MLAFGALIDLSLAPLAPELTTRLRGSLPAISGRVVVSAHGECAVAHLADARALPFDADLPLIDGDLVVAGTLRIDAQDELRRALSPDAPHALSTASDARLVALAYRRWSHRLAEHLIGDYAFVVWDRRERRLVCARDPHGNRPLFWGRSGSVLVVGSSPDVARSLPGVSSALHEPALVELLQDGYVTDAERTVYRDVRRLPAAHTLVCEDGSAPVLRRHWDFPVPSPIRYRRDDDYLAHFNEVLGSALRDRLRADSAAVFLSGGMDSTTLAVAARHAAPGVRLRAFTMTHPALVQSDDDALSVEAAERIGLVHEVLDLGQIRVPRQIEDVPSQPLDESDLAVEREALKPVAAFSPIVIYGEDGDALLQAPTLLGQLRTQPITEVMGAWTRYWWRTGRRPWVGLEWRDRLRRWQHGGEPDRTPWLRTAVRPSPLPATPEHPLRPRSVKYLSSVLWHDLYESIAPATTLAPVLHTLPFVDPRVMAFVFAIPPVPWCQNKHLLRAAMRDELPPAVLARPKTPQVGYLEALVAQWRARGGADTPVSNRVAPWVDIEAVRRILRSGTPYEVIDAWRVLQLDQWLQRQEGSRD